MAKKSILLVADPLIPVPPLTYGGVERIVDLLAEGLIERGWKVTLACHPESTCRVNHVFHPTEDQARGSRMRNSWNLLKHLATNHYDLIHSSGHFDLTLPLWPLRQNLIQTFHSPPPWIPFNKRVRLIPRRNLWFTTVGHHMVPALAKVAPTRGIHNAIKLEEFTFQHEVAPDAPLVFLGRIEQIKGAHTAIQVAKATNRKLVIAGNRSDDPRVDRYFLEQVEPYLSSGITYIGPVDAVQKDHLLGMAAALLMPIEWDEPFGLVMPEALACGTPVIGFARGALPEIVNHGVTGACCHSTADMITAVENVGNFSRRTCRQEVESRFSPSIMVDHYIDLYESILQHC